MPRVTRCTPGGTALASGGNRQGDPVGDEPPRSPDAQKAVGEIIRAALKKPATNRLAGLVDFLGRRDLFDPPLVQDDQESPWPWPRTGRGSHRVSPGPTTAAPPTSRAFARGRPVDEAARRAARRATARRAAGALPACCPPETGQAACQERLEIEPGRLANARGFPPGQSPHLERNARLAKTVICG